MTLIFPQRPLVDNLLCFATTRQGGVSIGPYQSFNLADHVSDNLEHVLQNRAILWRYLQGYKTNNPIIVANDPDEFDNSDSHIAPIKFLKQVHSASVLDYNKIADPTPTADAIYTNTSRVPLAVLTADCLPIVLASTTTNEYCAVHAGWKGLLSGIIENTVAMFDASRASLSAWVGPSICQQHFEVDLDVANRFQKFQGYTCKGNTPSKQHIDLSAIAQHILFEQGIKNVQRSKICTYCSENMFSFRRAKHAGFDDCGRIATVVMKY